MWYPCQVSQMMYGSSSYRLCVRRSGSWSTVSRKIVHLCFCVKFRNKCSGSQCPLHVSQTTSHHMLHLRALTRKFCVLRSFSIPTQQNWNINQRSNGCKANAVDLLTYWKARITQVRYFEQFFSKSSRINTNSAAIAIISGYSWFLLISS